MDQVEHRHFIFFNHSTSVLRPTAKSTRNGALQFLDKS